MASSYVDVRDTRVFVDDRGAHSTAVLHVHGGPGQGSHDFMASVGDSLARHVRLVGVDQRGALRSDPLPPEPPLTQDLIVADFEQVRRARDIEKWVLVAHSAGAPLALHYALNQPDVVSGVVFVCPTFDADLTDRYRLPMAAERLRALGRHEAAARCEQLATMPRRLTAHDDSRAAVQALGEHYLELFFADADGQAAFARIMSDPAISDEQHERGQSHRPLLAALYDSTLGLLPRLRAPSLLVHGESDVVAAPAIIEAYRTTTPHASVVTIQQASHFPYVEQPDAFVAAVLEFVAGLD